MIAKELRQARAEGRAKGRAEVVRLHQRTCIAIIKWTRATHLFSDELERLMTGTDQVEEWLRLAGTGRPFGKP